MDGPVSLPGMILLVVVLYGGAVLYPILQVMAFWNWKGWWRLLAVPPFMVMVPIGVDMVNAFRLGSNLAPLVFLFVAPLATAWLFVFGFIRRRVVS
jgi:hypothetical protein